MEEKNLTAENLAGGVAAQLKDREKLVQMGLMAKTLGQARRRQGPREADLRPRGFPVRFLRLRRLHFVGAGGVGMSGIAEILLQSTPLEISGCDLARSENTARLEALGAKIALGHDPAHVESADLVVISSAVGGVERRGRGRTRPGHPGDPPGRDARRDHAAEAGDRRGRHAREDHDDLADGDGPDGGGLRSRRSSSAARSTSSAPTRGWERASTSWPRPTSTTAPSWSSRPWSR